VTITKLMDLEKAGIEIIILLADVHALLNRKGSKEEIQKEVENWRKTIKAIGLKAKVVLGSDFEFNEDYQMDVMALAQNSTIQRGLRSMQEIARDVDNATISQLWYPLMQVADIKHLGVDIALGGLEQRKVHMIGKDLAKILNYNFVALHTPLITSLKGPDTFTSSDGTILNPRDSFSFDSGFSVKLIRIVDDKIAELEIDKELKKIKKGETIQLSKNENLHCLDLDKNKITLQIITFTKQKMSKSIPGSGISVIDSYDEIKKTINGAYCPEGIIDDNPLLQIMKLIIFPRFEKIEIKRPEKFGGNLSFANYFELEKIYSEKKLHPMDLKSASIEYLEKIIKPIREKWK